MPIMKLTEPPDERNMSRWNRPSSSEVRRRILIIIISIKRAGRWQCRWTVTQAMVRDEDPWAGVHPSICNLCICESFLLSMSAMAVEDILVMSTEKQKTLSNLGGSLLSQSPSPGGSRS